MRRQFRTRVFANILYSTLVTVAMEIVLVMNLTFLADYAEKAQWENALLSMISSSDVVIVLGYVLLGIAVFAVSFLLLQERSISYISRISDAVRNISEGDLNTSIEVIGDDEFSAMAENLNKMVEEIRRLMDKEREAERTKNELITNVAHDLRTPLTSIIGYLEILSGQKAQLTPEIQKKYLDIAYSKAKRLEKLIEDLFGFTKLNYGKISMHISRVDIIKLLSQLLEEAYPNFEKRGLSYELQSNVPAKVITADGNLLARLFDNLITNAIKYGAEGKRILVKVHAEEDTVQVAVANYGYVIPQEELPLLFEKFYRVEQSRSTTTGGTGLGLAIVKNIVDMHGGKITVKSDLNGTVFTVTLQVNFDINREHFGEPG
ncbi:MAG: HAMP domain-containing histidine kinase [Clostridiales bacterium]|nr:HAMP domain-containing histidine kinase [Clostridiales bacterium]